MKKKVYRADRLRNAIWDAIKGELDLDDLRNKCNLISGTKGVIPLKTILKQSLPKITKMLEEKAIALRRLSVDPFSALDWPEDITCSFVDYDDDWNVIEGIECQEQATIVLSYDEDCPANICIACDKHFKREEGIGGLAWYAPLPLTEDLLDESEPTQGKELT